MTRSWVWVATLAVVAACGPAGGGGASAPAADSPSASASEPSPSASSPSTGRAEMLERLEPSVVSVTAGALSGSGVVYRAAGVLLTTAHLVGSAKTVQIGFADGSRSAGKVTATDQVADLAIVQVERANLVPVEFAASTPPPGSAVLVVGSPLGTDTQVSEGLVAAWERAVPGAAKAGRALVGLVRIDALLGGGHSGGAVVAADGSVIGIAETFPAAAAGAPPAAYMIPAGTVTTTAVQLVDGGKAKHAHFGASAVTVTLGMSQALDLGVNDGAVLREVTVGGPAAKAGLKAGDVVTGVNGVNVRTAEDLLTALRALAPGETVRVQVHRYAEGQSIAVVLGELRR